MKNLYWLSIAFGLVVAGFFLADRRFTEVGLIGALICAGLTLGLGFWWFKPVSYTHLTLPTISSV